MNKDLYEGLLKSDDEIRREISKLWNRLWVVELCPLGECGFCGGTVRLGKTIDQPARCSACGAHAVPLKMVDRRGKPR